MIYDSILMLSGGKDSCSLAFDLHEKGVKFLALTVNNGFMSDVAWSNIDKLVNILNIDSIVIRPAPTHYQEVIDKDEDMVHTCEACSFKTLVVAMQVAKLHGIKRIYAGFTKYTAIAQGWRGREIENAGEFEVVNPYYSEYDLNKIRATMESNGLVFDPTLTNCKHIQRLIHKSADNPFTRELDLLKEDGFIKDDEYSRFSEWLKSK
jgi:tRNA(Ile)-lysidine synthase TilS/MesJ